MQKMREGGRMTPTEDKILRLSNMIRHKHIVVHRHGKCPKFLEAAIAKAIRELKESKNS